MSQQENGLLLPDNHPVMSEPMRSRLSSTLLTPTTDDPALMFNNIPRHIIGEERAHLLRDVIHPIIILHQEALWEDLNAKVSECIMPEIGLYVEHYSASLYDLLSDEEDTFNLVMCEEPIVTYGNGSVLYSRIPTVTLSESLKPSRMTTQAINNGADFLEALIAIGYHHAK